MHCELMSSIMRGILFEAWFESSNTSSIGVLNKTELLILNIFVNMPVENFTLRCRDWPKYISAEYGQIQQSFIFPIFHLGVNILKCDNCSTYDENHYIGITFAWKKIHLKLSPYIICSFPIKYIYMDMPS